MRSSLLLFVYFFFTKLKKLPVGDFRNAGTLEWHLKRLLCIVMQWNDTALFLTCQCARNNASLCCTPWPMNRKLVQQLNHSMSSQLWRIQKRSKPPETSCDTPALNVRMAWNVERSITLINHNPICTSQQTLRPQFKQTNKFDPHSTVC